MGRYHSELLMAIFPHQKPTGVDLGNVEIKESLNGFGKYTVYPKDMKADYFLFYDQKIEEFYFCDTQDLPEVKRKRSFTTIKVEKVCQWKSKDVLEVLEKVEEVMTIAKL